MVPIPKRIIWHEFQSKEEQLSCYWKWGLISPKSTAIPLVMVVDGYLGAPEPCQVVGCSDDGISAIIRLEDGLHAIFGEYLAEQQPHFPNLNLPRGMTLSDILADYCVVDIETTGLSRESDAIIEVAAKRYHFGKEVNSFSSLVNPHRTLSKTVIKLTGITQEEVDAAPEWGMVAMQFDAFIGDLPLVGHNILSFDLPFLKAGIRQDISNPCIDTLKLARQVFPLLHTHKLEYLNNSLELCNGVSHRAEADVDATNALLWTCLAPRQKERQYMEGFLNHRIKKNTEKKLAHVESPKEPPVSAREETPNQPAWEWEAAAYEILLPEITKALNEFRLDAGRANFRKYDQKSSDYSAVFLDLSIKIGGQMLNDGNSDDGTRLLMRLRLRGDLWYMSIDSALIGDIPPEIAKLEISKRKDSSHRRFRIVGLSEVEYFAPMVYAATIRLLESQEKDIGCCARYLECSNARKCIYPIGVGFPVHCAYNANLRAGKIFYGANKNAGGDLE